MDLSLQARGDINHLPFACPSAPITVQSRLQRWPASQSEHIRGLRCQKQFSCPTFHVQGDLKLFWSHESDQVGSRQVLDPISQCVGIPFQRLSRNWGGSELSPRCPTGGRVGHCPVSVPQTECTLVLAQVASWLSAESSQPFRVHSMRQVGYSSQAEPSLLASHPNWLSLLRLSCYRP